MSNKEIIKKLKDYAELAWASYGYFGYLLEQNKPYVIILKNEKGKEIRDNNNKLMTKNIEITDILNIKYKNHRICELIQLGKETKEISIGKLDGDMTPTQAKNFFEKYKLLIHQPNTSSGFSATYKSQRLCQCSQL